MEASFQVQNGRVMGGMEQDQAAAAAAAPAAQGEVTELQRAAQRITNLLAQAAIQSDAWDERAKALGQALEGATQCLMLHLESYDQNKGAAATAKTTNSPEGITKATRDGSRSPRREEDALAASAAAAAKALASANSRS